jgi:hypothetical protein
MFVNQKVEMTIPGCKEELFAPATKADSPAKHRAQTTSFHGFIAQDTHPGLKPAWPFRTEWGMSSFLLRDASSV